MDKQEHAKLLRQAMAEKGYDRQVVADATNVKPRTVTNWRSGSTMPDERDMAALRRLFGDYDQHGSGDPVEAAVRRSTLHEWRQDAVLSVYKRNLHEQAAEEVRGA